MNIRQVLLIDDSDVDNFINQHILKKCNISESISYVFSALEAIAYLNSLVEKNCRFPELIFLDIQMPVMNGFDFLDQFHQYPESYKAECCIIMLSSSQNPQDIIRANANRYVRTFFSKPLTQKIIHDYFNQSLSIETGYKNKNT